MHGIRDPRWAVLAGVPALWVAGLCVLTLVGASPPRGWRVNRALTAEAEGKRAWAAEQLDQVAAAHPADASAWVRAGHALTGAGRPWDGADRLAHAVDLAPTLPKARYEWAKALLAEELDTEAEDVLRGLLEVKPDHGDGLFLYAAIAAGRGDVAAAASRFAGALEARCSDPDRWREEPRFDAVRADPRFLRVARDQRYAPALAAVRP